MIGTNAMQIDTGVVKQFLRSSQSNVIDPSKPVYLIDTAKGFAIAQGSQAHRKIVSSGEFSFVRKIMNNRTG